ERCPWSFLLRAGGDGVCAPSSIPHLRVPLAPTRGRARHRVNAQEPAVRGHLTRGLLVFPPPQGVGAVRLPRRVLLLFGGFFGLLRFFVRGVGGVLVGRFLLRLVSVVGGVFGTFRSVVRFLHGAGRRSLGFLHGRLLRAVGLHHELDHGHGRVVPLAVADLDDAGVPAGPLGHRRGDLREQLVNDGLALAIRRQRRLHLTPCGEVAALRLSDEALGYRAQALGLRLGRADAAVLEQRNSQVGKHTALVSRPASEAGTLRGRGHGLLQFWYRTAGVSCTRRNRRRSRQRRKSRSQRTGP